MYSFDEEKEQYYFSNDLKEYLLNHGVDANYITKMQNKMLQESREEYYETMSTSYKEHKKLKLVPLEKVIGTSRGTVGQSVYENVRTMHKGAREPYRFKRCFGFFEEYSFEELEKSYEELIDPVRMAYYVDDDKYFVIEGNHRTLTAMLVGVKYIKAEVTNCYCNKLVKEKFFCSREFMKKYNIIKIMSRGNDWTIFFEENDNIYEVHGYLGVTEGEDFFALINRLSRNIDEDLNIVNQIMKLPPYLQRIVINHQKNIRIKQHIHKKYISKEDLEFWNYKWPVYLYKL